MSQPDPYRSYHASTTSGGSAGQMHTSFTPTPNPALPPEVQIAPSGVRSPEQRESSYCVGFERIVTAEDMPGFRSADTRAMSVGTLVLDVYGCVWRLQCKPGLIQKEFVSLGSVLPVGWDVDFDPSTSPDSVRAYRRYNTPVLHCRIATLAHVLHVWSDEHLEDEVRAGLQEDFFEELIVQLHRPSPARSAHMKIVKTSTERGRAVRSNVDPLTPWALRAAGEKLVADIAEDGEHEVSDINVKRLRHLALRHSELQEQLDEVAGHLQAAHALLLGEAHPVGTDAATPLVTPARTSKLSA